MSYVGKITDTSGNTGLVGSTLYGTCSTGASTAAKVVTCADFDELLIGVTIHVKFTYQYTGDVTPTLNVNNTGAKSITVGTHTSGNMTLTKKPTWNNGQVVSFTYDGTNWCMNEYFERNTDVNVTQTEVTTDAEYEVTFAGSTGTTTTTGGVGKSQYFKYNPSDKQLSISDTSSSSGVTHNKAIYMSVDEMKMYKQDYSSSSSRSVVSSGADLTGLFTKSENWNNGTLAYTYGNIQITPAQIVGKYGTTQKFLLDTSNGNEVLAGSLTIGNPDTAEYTGLKYDGSRGALTIVGGQQYSGAAFYEPILTVKNNSQTMGTASINITPENIYFQDDTWDGTNASLKDAISSLNSRTVGIKQVVAGTKVVSTTALNYKQIFTNAEINTLLGVTGSSNGNIVVLVENGDYSAQPKYLGSVVYENGNYFVKPIDNSSFTVGNLRINYVIIRFA